MEDYVKDTLTASPYPFWITMLLFVGISAFINYLIVYSKEKARRKVEEKTAARITKEIESVKESYNKALESHKIELQKEFEKSKYTISLCQKLDEKLIELLLDCHLLIDECKFCGGIECYDKKDITDSLTPLCAFLSKYSSRYSSNEIANNIINLGDKLEYVTRNGASMEAQIQKEEGDENFTIDKYFYEISSDILFASSHLLSVLLPSFSEIKPEQ